MGSGGTEWETADNFEPTRLNQKTRFVGGDLQLTNAYYSAQSGQQAFITTSGATYRKDKISTRNSANNTWNAGKPITVTTGTLGTLTDGSGGNAINRKIYTLGLTFPTSEKFYIITDLEAIFSPPGGAANAIMGVDILSGDNSILMALTSQFDANVDATVKKKCSSKIILGGTTVYGFISSDANSSVGSDGVSATRYKKAFAYDSTPEYAESNTVTTDSTHNPEVKIYYTGWS